MSLLIRTIWQINNFYVFFNLIFFYVFYLKIFTFKIYPFSLKFKFIKNYVENKTDLRFY